MDGCLYQPVAARPGNAVIVAGPHGLTPQLIDALTDSDPGREPLPEVQTAPTPPWKNYSAAEPAKPC